MSDEPKIDFSMLLASSVHDMKNSLGMLLQSLESLFGKLPDEYKQELSVAQYETSRVNNDLVQLLGLYRLQKERMAVVIDEHCVLDIIEEQQIKNRMLCESHGVQINIDCDENLMWYFDEYLIASVINNILVNAIRYTKSIINININLSDEFLSISITDDGPGFPDHMLKDPSSHVAPDKRHASSTCLGLYFASEIAQLHRLKAKRGSIELSNGGELGGSNFTMLIP